MRKQHAILKALYSNEVANAQKGTRQTKSRAGMALLNSFRLLPMSLYGMKRKGLYTIVYNLKV